MDTLYAASHWDELKLFVYEIDAREYLMETFGMTKEEAQENIWEIPAKHLGKEKERMKLLKALWFALDIDVADMVAWLKSIGLTLAIIAIPIGFFMLLGFTMSDTIRFVGLAMGIVVILVFIVMGALTVVRYIKRVMLWYRRLSRK